MATLVLHCLTAVSAVSEPTRFTIKEYVIEGNTLLLDRVIRQWLTPYFGADCDLDDVKKAVQALRRLYHDSGHLRVDVVLPEQNFKVGKVVLKVIENPAIDVKSEPEAVGNVALTGVLDSQNIKEANEDNTGGVSTSGPVVADNGNVSTTANSPLTTGESGVTARGNITLAATDPKSAANMTIDEPVVSNAGEVNLTADSNLMQNGLVSAPMGVTAGVITEGDPEIKAEDIAMKPQLSTLTPVNLETCLTNPILCDDNPEDFDPPITILPNTRTDDAASEIMTYIPSSLGTNALTFNDIVQAKNEARKADDEAKNAQDALRYAGTLKHEALAIEYALVKSAEADAKRASAKILGAEFELSAANAEAMSSGSPQEKMRAESRRAVAESKRAEGEVDKAEAQTRLAECDINSAQTPEAKAVALGKLAASQAQKADAEAKKAVVDVKKAETEIKQAEAEAKASSTQYARQAVESKKADLQAKKAEAEIKNAEAEVKSAKTPAAKADEKMAAAEIKKADAEAKKSEVQARHAEERVKLSDSVVDKQAALAQKADAEVKKAEVEVIQAQIDAKTASTPKALKAAEEKQAKAQARKAELEQDKAEQEVKVAEAIAAKSSHPQAKNEVEVKKADAEVKKADAQVKKAEADIKTANTPQETAQSRHHDAESKKIDAELKKAEIEASQDKAAANATQSTFLKNAVDKKANSSAARVEAFKAERDVIRAKSDVKQAELAVKESQTPEARTAVEKQLGAIRSQTLVREQKLALLKADANAKDAESKLARRSSDNKVSEMFGGMALAKMSAQQVKEAMVARHEFMQDTLKTAINLLKANPLAANIRPCGTDGGDTCIRSVNTALTALATRNRVSITTPTLSYVPAIQRKVAVVIGNNAYQDPKIPSLDGAIKDADAIGALLKEKMGYDVYVMHNGTKADIIRKLNQVADETRSADSVVVYYAGHGHQIEETRMGYWIPIDASAIDPVNWISNSDISDILATIQARQIILMSDSCYSGTLPQEQRINVDMTREDIQNILSKRSVLVMTSGGEEPVLDDGREGRSIFAWHLIDRLNKVTQYKSGFEVLGAVKSAVAREGIPQTPQYGASISAGHTTGGEYLFEVRKYKPSTTSFIPHELLK